MREDYLSGDEEQLGPKDREFERALRPLSFEDFTGQAKIIENLRVFVHAAKKRNEPLDHVLLHGPPGLGKPPSVILSPTSYRRESKSLRDLCSTSPLTWQVC